jgi:hypothetical protein
MALTRTFKAFVEAQSSVFDSAKRYFLMQIETSRIIVLMLMVYRLRLPANQTSAKPLKLSSCRQNCLRKMDSISMTDQTRAAIAGYGNLGRSVEASLAQNPDMELLAIGWDPGLMSLNRLFGETILPKGKTGAAA